MCHTVCVQTRPPKVQANLHFPSARGPHAAVSAYRASVPPDARSSPNCRRSGATISIGREDVIIGVSLQHSHLIWCNKL
jgi:hypothetical protein